MNSRMLSKKAGVPIADASNYIAGRFDKISKDKAKIMKMVADAGPSQTEVVEDHFRSYSTITTIQAIKLYGILRLSERVRELNARYQRNGDTRRIINTQTGRGIGKCAIYQMVNTEEK